VLGVFATAVLVVLGFTILGGGSNGETARPKLELVRSRSFTVRGRHFRPHEQVKVTVGTSITPAKANGDGLFVVRIRGATRCDTIRVLARGSAGSYAVLKLLPMPACMPARSG
jgi:hypothetical protein